MKLIGIISIEGISKVKLLGFYLIILSLWLVLTSLADRFVGGDTYEGLVLIDKFRYYGILIGGMAVVVILHEGLHGLGFLIYGGKVKFGATIKTKFGLVFYATSPNTFYSRNQMIVIALLPQIMTVGLLASAFVFNMTPMMAWVVVMLAVVNLIGGSMDILGSCWLATFPRSSLVEDAITEARVFIKN